MLVITTLATAQAKKTTSGAKPAQTTAPKETSYPTVTIGNQVWMTKNLDVSTFRNGDPIPQVQSIAEWKKASNQKKPAWCYYQVEKISETKYFGEPDKSKKYGKLYNWYAVSDPRGLAPKGWHVPSNDEWKELFAFVENNINHGEYNVEQDVANALNSKSGWGTPVIKGINNPKYLQGTDLFGFNVLPGGFRSSGDNNSGFSMIGREASFIINAEPYEYQSRVRLYSITISDNNYRFDDFLGPGEGLSVRCVKAKEYEPTAQDFYNNGTTKFNSKDYNGAIEEYTKAIALSPDSFLCYYQRGNMKAWLKNWNEARIDHEKAWKLVQAQNLYSDASVKDLLYQLGGNFFSSDKEKACYYFNEAVKYGSEAAKQYIDKCDQERSDALLKSGILKYESKDFEGAISDFTASTFLSRNGNKGPIIFRRAESKFSLQRWEDAIKDYQRVWNIVKIGNYKDEEKSLVLFSLGKSYIQLNNLENACYFLNEAVKLKNTGAQELIDKFCNKGEIILQSEPILEQE